MKYCPKCKELAFADSKECAKCGTPLDAMSVHGASAGGPPRHAQARAAEPEDAPPRGQPKDTPPDADDGQHDEGASSHGGLLQLRKLVTQAAARRAKNMRASWTLIGVCAAAALAIVLILYLLYCAAVLSYARLENVEVTRDPTVPNKVNIAFDVVKRGKVRFVNRSGRNYAEKVDRYVDLRREQMYWMWSYDPEAGIHFTVRYRRGLFPAAVEKYFEPVAASLTVVLTLDVSGSMQGAALTEMKQAAELFLEELPLGVGGKAAIVVFGGRTGTVCPVTGDRQSLIQAVRPLDAGGGTPMDEGLRAATGLLKDLQETNRSILLFTDGKPANANSALAAATRAKDADITIWAVGISGAQIELLRRIASSPDKAFFTSSERLRGVFAQIARDLKAAFHGSL